jgi:hypothetical protein
MSRSILIEMKSQYGNDVIYPACDNAMTFAKLAGTKTLTKQALELIEQLGYTIVQEFGAEYKVVNSPDDYYAIVVVEFQDGSRVETNYKGEFDRA